MHEEQSCTGNKKQSVGKLRLDKVIATVVALRRIKTNPLKAASFRMETSKLRNVSDRP